jgi:hypothetical protein
MHLNASHIYVGGGGSEPRCGVRGGEAEGGVRGSGGSWRRAATAAEEEAIVEVAVEETGIERWCRERR